MGGNKNSLPEIFSSSHFLIGKKSFIQSGGFNETLDYYEDVEFFLRCKVFGLNVEVNKNFLAIHLKEFNLKSLINDYWLKTNSALQIRQKAPKLFKGNTGDIPLEMHISGGAGILLLFLVFIFISSKAFGFELISMTEALISIFSLSLFSLMTFPRTALKVSRIYSASLWTICYGTIWISLILSTIKISIFKIIDFIIQLSDFIRNGMRVVLRNGKPVQIINYVTSRCNLRCSHCFYKDSLNDPNPGEIPRKNLIKTMKDIGPVLWYSLAGGEPFIRNDLEDIVNDVHYYCRPKVFSFPTNGWYTERTFNIILRSLQRLKRGNIILFFSLDGPESIHDEIRGKVRSKNLLIQ